ncbi:MAG: hypothetical protein WAO13_26255, partial [Pseudolabrys sp.]
MIQGLPSTPFGSPFSFWFPNLYRRYVRASVCFIATPGFAMTELWDEHQRFRGSRCWKAMKMAMPITDTTT